MTYKFKREDECGLILFNIENDNRYELKMILDTGATNTTIDSNALYLLAHNGKENIGNVETANGIIETEVFEIDTFESLGVTKEKIKFPFTISWRTVFFQTTTVLMDLIF